MCRININPEEELISEEIGTTSKLEKMAFEKTLNQILALAFETPQEYKKFGKYTLFDRNYVIGATKKVNIKVPLMVLEKPQDFKYDEEYNNDYWPNLPQDEFENIVKTRTEEYLHYSKLL